MEPAVRTALISASDPTEGPPVAAALVGARLVGPETEAASPAPETGRGADE